MGASSPIWSRVPSIPSLRWARSVMTSPPAVLIRRGKSQNGTSSNPWFGGFGSRVLDDLFAVAGDPAHPVAVVAEMEHRIAVEGKLVAAGGALHGDEAEAPPRVAGRRRKLS